MLRAQLFTSYEILYAKKLNIFKDMYNTSPSSLRASDPSHSNSSKILLKLCSHKTHARTTRVKSLSSENFSLPHALTCHSSPWAPEAPLQLSSPPMRVTTQPCLHPQLSGGVSHFMGPPGAHLTRREFKATRHPCYPVKCLQKPVDRTPVSLLCSPG